LFRSIPISIKVAAVLAVVFTGIYFLSDTAHNWIIANESYFYLLVTLISIAIMIPIYSYYNKKTTRRRK
jgi:predicted tellurium resistance membrane protein TerC